MILDKMKNVCETCGAPLGEDAVALKDSYTKQEVYQLLDALNEAFILQLAIAREKSDVLTESYDAKIHEIKREIANMEELTKRLIEEVERLKGGKL